MDRPFPSYEGDDSYLFVSYAHDDTELTFPEMAWIKESGFNLWYDDGIHVGTVWRRALAEALNKSAGLIFFCTARSAESDNCLKEINFALDQGKTVFVVRLDDTPLPLELQLSLSDRQAMVRSDFDESTYRARLTSALASLVKPESQMGDGNSDSKKTTRTEWAMVVNPILASGTDEELHLIAEDLTDDLMTVIPKRFHGMTILTDQASDTALILSGTGRKRGAEVRTTMKLMSEFNHRQIWAETYDRPLQDFYQSQAQLINQICGSLQEPIIMAVQEYYKDIEDDELDAIGLLSRVFLKRFLVYGAAIGSGGAGCV